MELTQPRTAGRPLRILVADDHALNVRLLRAILEERGHLVVPVDNGREVLAELSREAYDLVLMDLRMPVLDGLETTAAIRAGERETGGHLPILAITAATDPAERASCRAAGMDGFVTKPFEYRDLIEQVEGSTRFAAGPAVPSSAPLPRDTLAVLFVEEAWRLGDAIGEALDGGAAGRVYHASHQLLGIAGHFKEVRLAEMAGLLEAAGKAGELERAGALYRQLLEELRRLGRRTEKGGSA